MSSWRTDVLILFTLVMFVTSQVQGEKEIFWWWV